MATVEETVSTDPIQYEVERPRRHDLAEPAPHEELPSTGSS